MAASHPAPGDFEPTKLAPLIAPKNAEDVVRQVADRLAERATPDYPFIAGITGSVAAGKTVFSEALAQRLCDTHNVEIISTDGFLFSNEVLSAKGLAHRKGFPETYDMPLLSGTLQRLRYGPVRVPVYSHALYDIDPRLSRGIDRPEIVLLEGLGLAPSAGSRRAGQHLDALIYIDAAEEDLEAWFAERFMRFWDAAEADSSSFYSRFRAMTRQEAEAFARQVWTTINLPNLRDHILQARDAADVIIRKGRDHAASVVDRLPGLGKSACA